MELGVGNIEKEATGLELELAATNWKEGRKHEATSGKRGVAGGEP